MFEIEDAIYFGDAAIKSIERKFDFYRSKELCCVLLNNISTYALDFEKYYAFSLRCATLSEELASINQNTTKIIHAKILRQIAYYKLRNKKFDCKHLSKLIEIFLIVDLDGLHKNFHEFITKHGIELKK